MLAAGEVSTVDYSGALGSSHWAVGPLWHAMAMHTSCVAQHTSGTTKLLCSLRVRTNQYHLPTILCSCRNNNAHAVASPDISLAKACGLCAMAVGAHSRLSFVAAHSSCAWRHRRMQAPRRWRQRPTPTGVWQTPAEPVLSAGRPWCCAAAPPRLWLRRCHSGCTT